MPPGSRTDTLLAFGAHPDDIEFGCGGVLALEARRGRPVVGVVCSRGESASFGTPEIRANEAATAFRYLGAELRWLDLGGDGRIEATRDRAITVARVIRETRPAIVLAPSPAPNQHPDHAALGALVRDAARLARYGGFAPLADLQAYGIPSLWWYAVGGDADPTDTMPTLVDVSDPAIVTAWTAAMAAHISQAAALDYTTAMLTRAQWFGVRATVSHAIPLWPADPIVVKTLDAVGRTARGF